MTVIVAGPDWTSATTAIGTVLVAIAAVGIAIWTEHRIGKRVAAEHARSGEVLAEERALADKRLAEQLEHSDAQLATERAAADARLKAEQEHADARLREERQLTQDREQLAEAYAVEVAAARMSAEAYGSKVASDPDVPIECAAAIVVNRGRYTITQVEAQLCLGGNSLLSYGKIEQFSSWWNLVGSPLTKDLSGPEHPIRFSTLTPSDLGLRFVHDAVAVRRLLGSYPVVRWRDRWGTRWEHKLGEVRQITEDEPWKA